MSALFDDAERFEPHIVVGDTVRHVKNGTEEHVGPGTYSPSMANSNEFGFIGVSSSRRSTMDPPASPRSSEHQRYVNGSVVRDGVWFHSSPFQPVGPGPGSYSPPIIPTDYMRGRTAKPSSGPAGRQAWDLRGSAGGISLANFRGGFTVSSSMGNSARVGDFSQVALRDGVLLLRGSEDGHRSNGVGPGTYDGASNRQDPLTKRSYNVRAQCSQVRRERSLSFSGTSSTARAFLSLNVRSSPRNSSSGRPDLHLIARRAHTPTRAGSTSPRRSRRCVSPASAIVSSMRPRVVAEAATASFGCRSGGQRARSLSPKRNHQRPPAPPSRVSGCTNHTWGAPQPLQGDTTGPSSPKGRGCRSISPRPVARRAGGGDAAAPWGSSGASFGVPVRGRQGKRASSASPRRQKASSARFSPRTRKSSGRTTGAAGGGSYTYDYFGMAGQKGAWRGLEAVSAARAEVGITAPNETPTEAERGRKEEDAEREAFRGEGGGAETLLPEEAPMKGVCAPSEEYREDTHRSSEEMNNTPAALDDSSDLPPPPTGP